MSAVETALATGGERFLEEGGAEPVFAAPEARGGGGPGSSPARRALDAADDACLEYIAFRGFGDAFRSFSSARGDDRARRGSFDAKFVTDALLRAVGDLDGAALLDAWDFVDARFLGGLDAELAAHGASLARGSVVESITGRRPAWDIFKPLYLAQIEVVFHDS